MEKNICIISFSPIFRDARVLRQIKYLSPHYGLTVVGYGKPHPNWAQVENVHWISLDSPGLLNPAGHQDKGFYKDIWSRLKKLFTDVFKETWVMRLFRTLLSRFRLSIYYAILGMGRFHRFFYEWWYWRNIYRMQALEYAAKHNCDAYHANDWDALPVAAEAAKRNGSKVVFDAHEYAPLELENHRSWRLFIRPAIIYFIKKYLNQIEASVTVAPRISERYKQEYNLDPIVVLNAPENPHVPSKLTNFDHIQMVYHGGASKDRRLESMIETLAFCDRRFSLNFILVENDSEYSKHLKTVADRLTPGRVSFVEPVPPEKIVQEISKYDIGFYLLEPNSYNNYVALPNKFFDFIGAGLAVCIGPSPSMAEIVQKYGFGIVAPSFRPQEVAKTLNQLTVDELRAMRLASGKAAEEINAKKEMLKLVDLYNRLLGFD